MQADPQISIKARPHRKSNKKKIYTYANGHDFMASKSIFTKKTKNYKAILELLETRSWATFGDTKFFDSNIAEILGISIRCVQYGLDFLEKHGFISRIERYVRIPETGEVRSDRFIRVFTVFYDRGCKPLKSLWMRDFRPTSNFAKLRENMRKIVGDNPVTPIKTFKLKKEEDAVIPEHLEPLVGRGVTAFSVANANNTINNTWNVKDLFKSIVNSARKNLVEDEVIANIEDYMVYRNQHPVGEHSLSVQILGYPVELLKAKRSKK